MSEWPTSLLMDEAWLMVRRNMVCSFEAKDIWLSPAEYKEIWQQQLELGNQLRKNILLPVLGAADYARLSNETLFGKYNHQFQRKLPFSLAFGYETGSLVNELFNQPAPQQQQIREICALFNLGISLFDFILDQPATTASKNHFFNEETMAVLHGRGNKSKLLLPNLDKIKAAEWRILLKVITGFYGRLFQLLNELGQSSKPITSLLEKAYKAEMSSTEASVINKRRQLQISRSKSVLPFEIIGAIGMLTISKNIQVQKQGIVFAKTLGDIFWITDDLADIVRDAQSGQLNVFLKKDLATTLQGDLIGSHTRSLVQEVEFLIRTLYKKGRQPALNFHYRQTLLFYLKDWLN